MKLIYKLLHQDPDSREGIVTVTSGLGIFVNVLVATVKVVIGLFSSSIAMVSEGVNNGTDALSSVLALVGTKLGAKHPDKKHPFGYGRIEYLTSLVIAVMILVGGIEILTDSVKRIFHPEAMEISYVTVIIIAVTAFIKLALGLYTIKMGKKAESTALEAVGIECRNDCFISVVTVATFLIFILFGVSLDAYAGLFTSALIMKAGFEVLRSTVSDLLGRPGDEKLAALLYREIRSTPGVLAAADMMLHNYGPDAWSGSCNIELDHGKTVGEVYEVIHDLQLRIMHTHHVTMVFGIYAVDNDGKDAKEMRKIIGSYVLHHSEVHSFHALYCEPQSGKIYVDLVLGYEARDWDAVREEFLSYFIKYYPDREVVLTLETEYV